ncbi:MAG TPA: glycosyltransferase [Opitutaceae bacterium]|jgi:N-acetylglucosaminyl-diphospho-decaprenol L-rhamnosyltransferase|nr:glycosyltransferase [Opitutaceae bacterium]
MPPRLAFIIVSYNTRDLLDACLASVYRQTAGLPFEIIVVDNASHDGSPAMVREKYPEAVLVESGENLGFGRANNLGFSRSRAPFVMLLNSDALLLEDTGTALVRFLETNPRAGIVGPEIVLMDGTRQPKTRGMLPTARVMMNQNLLLCRLFPRSRFLAGLYVEADWGREARVGWVSGVCLVVRREAYAQSHGFDPEIFMYAEDVDLCRRCAALGWETWRVNAHAVKHLCGGSTKTEAQVLRNRVLQQRNFLRLLDQSMGPAGRAVTRLTFVVGLSIRSVLRGLASLVGGAGRRLAFRADLRCLSDFIGLTRNLPGDRHAHRT